MWSGNLQRCWGALTLGVWLTRAESHWAPEQTISISLFYLGAKQLGLLGLGHSRGRLGAPFLLSPASPVGLEWMCGAGGMMTAFAGFHWVCGLQAAASPALPSPFCIMCLFCSGTELYLDQWCALWHGWGAL